MKWPNIIGFHTMAWLGVAGLLVFFSSTAFASGQTLLAITSSMNLGVSVAVLFTWGPAALFSIRRKALGKNQLIVAVFTIFVAFVGARAYNVIYTAFGDYSWPDDAIRAFFGYLIFLCGLLFLMAPANVEYPEIDYKSRITWASILGIITMAIAFWAQTMGILN